MASPSELVAQQNDSHSDNEAVNSSASSSRSSSRTSSSQMDPIPHSSSYFHALNSPPGRRTVPSPITNEQETQRPSASRSSYEVPLLDADSPRHSVRQVSASSAGRTHGSRLSEAVSESYGQWHRSTAPSAVSAHSSRPSNTSMTHQQSIPADCNVDLTELAGRPVCNNTALPSCNYYVDNNGQMRIRKLWWCYMRIRRVLWCVFPWLKRDSNTYLCARMLANSTLIVVVYLLRELLNHVVVPAILKHKDTGAGYDAERQCHDHSLEFLDMYAYSLVANVLLCLPALNFKACRLYRRARREYSTLSSTSSNDEPDVVAPSSSVADITKEHQRFEKTYLFTLCELIVVIEIPYLIYILVVMFVPSESGSVSELLADCNRQLATGYFVILIAIQLAAVVAYLLRWRQILLFHRLHQHFLFQRGYVPGHSRFDYIERSFATPLYAWLPAPLWACWSRFKKLRSAARAKRTGGQDGEYSVPSGSNKKQIHYVKVELYSAAKRGDVEQVRSLLETAVSISGPEFATEWYEPHVWKLGGLVLLARGQRNPLHVAVAFDQIEVVRELLANGHFEVQQYDKLELLRLDLAWVYRLWFRVLFFVVRRSSAGVVASASAGGGAGNGGAAPGLASASHPFGPVGLFQATLLTPLHVAVTLGHIELALLLLRYGAKPDTSALSTHPRFATPPLYWAVDKECTRLLLDAGGNPLALPGDASGLLLTAFEVARIAGNAAVARQMEKYGGDVALTPLHDACASGRRHEVAFLLEHGADPDTLGEQVVGCFRRTPLHWAAMRGHARIIRLLVKYGGNVDARDVFGRTPLAWACVLNRTRAVETLLESGADVNVLDAQGDPLLCICAAGACASIKRGAKSSAGKRDKLGDDRVQEDNCDDAGYEEGPGVMLNGQRSLARGLDPRIFQLLLDYGVDLHATRTSNGDSALHVALRRRNQTAAVLFVRAGLSLTAVNLLGQRAIDCARSPALRFAVKKEAGQRDVMISYSHAHAPLARKIRDALERQRVTTWIDTMGPTGITGGSVWRQEIARGIQSSALVLAVLTKDYPQSQWCMKELAFAKMQNIPVVAIQCEDMEISEELQVYLWTRQVIDFRPAVKHNYGESIPYPLSEDKEEGAKERPMITSNSSHTMEDTDSREDDPGYRSDDDSNDVTNMIGKRVTSSLELVPDYNDDAFCHCLRMLLDGIQDQIDEHRARLARRQEQQQQQVQLGRDPDGKTDGDASRHGSRRNDSECYPEEEEKGLCGIPSASDNPTECEDSDAQISFPEGPLNVPLFRPLRRIDSLASSLAFTSASDSFVFIAHGDFHRSFCMRLQKALLKQGIRCVVDQTVPAVQYAHQPQDRVDAEAQSSGFGTDLGGLDHPVARLPVQNRQLAAKDAIIACSAVLVVLSPLSANCDLLADQLAFAEDRGKLLVPILLSLHKVDLAKRYTFSRSMIQHFNISLGYEQSIEQLTNYLQAQQQTEARQRRLQRRQEDQGDLGVSLGAMAVLSPISSASSAQSRRSSLAAYTDVVQVQSPFDEDLLSTDSSLLLPTLPVRTFIASSSPGLNTSRTGSRVGSTSSGGHGWSEPDIVEAARHDDHLHNSFRHDRSRTASGVSNASARSRESSLRLTGSTRHHPSTAEDII